MEQKMEQKTEIGTATVQVETYEAPRIEVIEMEVEDAVLTGTPSMPYESPWR